MGNKLKVTFLDEEPKRKVWYNQILYAFTRPIAYLLDELDTQKQDELYRRRREIAKRQQADFIIEVAQLLYDEVLSYGVPNNIKLCKMLCVDEARAIFNEKKSHGDFDDLNVIL